MFVTLGIPDEPVSAVIDRVRRTATGSLSEQEWPSEYGPLLVRPPKTSEERAVWSPPRAAHLSSIKALLVANLFSHQNRHILPLLLRAALSGAAPVAHLAIVHPPTGGSYEGDDV